MKILITGGAGYIGATVASACIDAGLTPIILDDLSTGRRRHLDGRIAYVGDIGDGVLIDRIAAEHDDIFAVIHCAARIVVPESVTDPLGYYMANVAKTIQMLEHIRRNGIERIVFSSTAAVYAADEGQGVSEGSRLEPTSPYARTKSIVETILRDMSEAGQIRALALRYFNPIGVDPQHRSGSTSDNPTHVLARMLEAWADGTEFTITGTDWPTRDGTGLRDFIHVWDLAQAHVRAIERFDLVATGDSPYLAINIGTGAGTTVGELAAKVDRALAGGLSVRPGARRLGDSAGAFALVDRAHDLLEWTHTLAIEDGIRDAIASSELGQP